MCLLCGLYVYVVQNTFQSTLKVQKSVKRLVQFGRAYLLNDVKLSSLLKKIALNLFSIERSYTFAARK